LGFVPSNNWPLEYKNNLLVAYHGSWNRTDPTGYKIARMVLDEKGTYQYAADFISGWLTSGGALGRPVDIIFNTSGILFISDDKAGVIYKVNYAS
jgi:glucose/arabinose dehydrogenase